jgi:hypothetical protein
MICLSSLPNPPNLREAKIEIIRDFAHLFSPALLIKNILSHSLPNPTSGETPVKSTQTCFPPIHSYTITSVGLRVSMVLPKI